MIKTDFIKADTDGFGFFSIILSIVNCQSVCSVALSMDGEVLFAKASFDGPSHAALLGVFVEEALSVLKRRGRKPWMP